MELRLRSFTFLKTCPRPENYFTLNQQNNSFVNRVKYLYVMFNVRIEWRPYIEIMEAKSLRTFIRKYCVIEREHLSSNIRLTLHRGLIKPVMT